MSRQRKRQSGPDMSRYHDDIEMAGAGIKDVANADPNHGTSDVKDYGSNLKESFFDAVKQPPPPQRPPPRVQGRPRRAPQYRARPAARPQTAAPPAGRSPQHKSRRPPARQASPASDPREATIRKYKLLKEKYKSGEINAAQYRTLEDRYRKQLGLPPRIDKKQKAEILKKKLKILDDRFLNDEIAMEPYDRKKAELEAEIRKLGD